MFRTSAPGSLAPGLAQRIEAARDRLGRLDSIALDLLDLTSHMHVADWVSLVETWHTAARMGLLTVEDYTHGLRIMGDSAGEFNAQALEARIPLVLWWAWATREIGQAA